jgi:hypothetical protein
MRPYVRMGSSRIFTGCRYEASLCNVIEACFDDGLFGQCWPSGESMESATVPALDDKSTAVIGQQMTELVRVRVLSSVHSACRAGA